MRHRREVVTLRGQEATGRRLLCLPSTRSARSSFILAATPSFSVIECHCMTRRVYKCVTLLKRYVRFTATTQKGCWDGKHSHDSVDPTNLRYVKNDA